jgi:hypothetical protein
MDYNIRIIFKCLIISLLLKFTQNWDYITQSNSSGLLFSTEKTCIIPAIATLSNGNYIASCISDKIIFYKIIDPQGKTVLDKQTVYTGTYSIISQTVATDPSGGFIFIWGLANNMLQARYYDTTYIGGNVINIYDGSFQVWKYYDNFAAFLSNGKFLSICASNNNTNISFFVKAQQIIPGANIARYLDAIKVPQSTTSYEISGGSFVSLGNGNFVITFKTYEYNPGMPDIAAIIYKESDFTIIKSQWRVSDNPMTNKQDSSVELLSNGNFIIVWGENITSQDSDINGQLYTIDGTPVGTTFKINMTMLSIQPVVKSLGSDGLVVAYLTGPTQLRCVYYQLLANDGTKIGPERQVRTGLPYMNVLGLSVSPGKGFMMVHYDYNKNNVFLQTFLKDTGACTNLTYGYGKGNMPRMNLPSFNTNSNNMWIILKTNPNSSLTSTTTSIEVDTLYDKTSVYYYDMSTGGFSTYSFTYVTNYLETPCTVTLVPCDVSCSTCNYPSNSTKPNCITCTSGYLPLEDDSSKCYNTVPSEYYNGTTVWKKCGGFCKTCSVSGTTIYCNSCIDNYYQKIDFKTGNCYTGSVQNYYLNSANKYYYSCFVVCTACTGYPTNASINMLCTSCKSGYYPKSDNMTSCFSGIQAGYTLNNAIYQKNNSSTSPNTSQNNCPANSYHKEDDSVGCFTGAVDFYYFDGSLFKKCYNTCQSCLTIGTSSNQQCSQCISGYYPKEDNVNSCFTGTQTGYVLNGTIYNLIPQTEPNPTPNTTLTPETSEINPYPNQCQPGYFYKEDDKVNCYTGSVLFYYFDGNMYKKCYSSCQTCTGQGNEINNECLRCISGYYPKSDLMNNCYNSEQLGYYLSNNIYQKCFSSCQTCSTLGNDLNHNCTKCIANYYPKTDNTSSCFTGNQEKYYIDGLVYQNCYPTCLTCTNIAGTSDNHQCVTCESGYYPKLDNFSSCFTGQQNFYYLDNNIYKPCKVQSCSEELNIQVTNCQTYEANCVDKCPENTIQVKSICQPILSTISNKILI